MTSTSLATSGSLRSLGQSRGGKIVLLGALCVLLQNISAPYTAYLFGRTENASLLHLHAGLLLAIAMLDRDRRVLVGAYAMVFLGWIVRASAFNYDMAVSLPNSVVAHGVGCVWTILCAHWMGWPKPQNVRRVEKRDLSRFAGFGLLLYPLGLAALQWLATWHVSENQGLVEAIQILFAKYFGVAVLTFPLVMAWSERRARWVREIRWQDGLWPLLLCLGLVVGVVASGEIRTDVGGLSTDRFVVLMDYRFALFALLGWCVLRLRTRVSMLLLGLTLFVLVQALSGTAERNGTPTGFVNLVYLAFELGVLLMAMLYFVVFERDGSELADRLESETLRDTATGLPNLTALRQDIKHRPLPRARGEVGFLLLDHADDLVAGFGLDMQSQVMNTVATRLAGVSRPFLVGMGQFALLPSTDEAGEAYWEQVMDAVQTIEVDSGGHRFGISPYLGVAQRMDAIADTVETALLQASQLAFEARRRNEVRPLHDDGAPSSESGAMRQRLHVANDALACLRNQRVELHFQPIRPLDLVHPGLQAPDHATGEVLCRLRGARGELVYPDDFLGPIEAVGRSVELDLAVLNTLFNLLREYPRASSQIKRMAINLTGQSLASQSFRRQFEALLATSPLPLSALCFEITENAVISSKTHTHDFLDGLRQRGCRIAIDDFGKGMQSFARLKELPVDIVKIDGAFVRHVAEHGRDHALVKASVTIARAFDAETVAEFVETEATADCLRELGVQWAQGYLYARPQPLAEMLARAD